MDYTLREWVDIAGNEPLSSAALQAQMEESGEDAEGILSRMQALLQCMKEAVRDGMQENLKSVSGMTGGQASRLFRRYREGKAYCGSLLGKATAYALATAESNACMGKIVAAPTAGACGVLPGAILALLEEKQPTPSRQALDRFSAERAPSSRLRVILWPLSAAACITAAWLLLNWHKEQADLRLGTEALTEIFSHEYEPEQLTQLFNEP